MSRVFQTVCQLIKYNGELSASATIQATQVKCTNGSVIHAVLQTTKGKREPGNGSRSLTRFRPSIVSV